MSRGRPLDPADQADFRTALGRVPTAVAVVASHEEDGPLGVSIGSFTSVSLTPPLVGFFIAGSSSTWPRIAQTGGFCASVLAADQEEVSRRFATSGADKFSMTAWTRSPAGRPVISGSIAWFDCTIVQTAPAGDHILVLGQIDHMEVAGPSAPPLLFLGGTYASTPPPSERAVGSWA